MAGREGDRHQVGDVIAGKYRIERVLGRGGMGVVVAARHLALRELRAIKFMSASELRNADAEERFRREAEAASRLKSPHVVKVFDIDRTDAGDFYIVMEYLEGQDLKTILATRGDVLPVHEAADYVRQACLGTAEAHRGGIVHRDLKLGNLFVTQDSSGRPLIKMLDFGLAKVRMPNDDRPDITKTSMILGSPAYMSPEQIRSARDADGRTDIWALGVILYKLTTGKLPFDAPSVHEVFNRILAPKPIRAPSSHRIGLPTLLDDIVAKCLERNIERRFQAAELLAQALLPLAEIHVSDEAPQNFAGVAEFDDADSEEITAEITTQARARNTPYVGSGPHSAIVNDSEKTTEPRVRTYSPQQIVAITADPNLSLQVAVPPEVESAAFSTPTVVQLPSDSDVSIRMFTRVSVLVDSVQNDVPLQASAPKLTIVMKPGASASPGTPVLPFTSAESPVTRALKRMLRDHGRIKRRAPLTTRDVDIVSVVVGIGIGALVVWIVVTIR